MGALLRLPASGSDLLVQGETTGNETFWQTSEANGCRDRGEPSRAERAAPSVPRSVILSRGRVWVAFWLAFILGVLGWVVARQTASHVAAAELGDLREEREALESERVLFQQRIVEAESPQVLGPKAEAMGLRVPPDSETTRLRSIRRRP